MNTARRWPRRLALGVLLGLTLAACALALVLATSGVFDRRPGAWTVPMRALPGVTVDANVAGLLRLATSPLGMRLLDGRHLTTRAGYLALAREHDTLVVRCAPCRVSDARLASKTVALPPIELRATRRAGIESNRLLDLRLETLDVAVDAVAQLSPTGIALDWSLPATPIAAVYRVLADAVPEARIARIDGRVQASGQLALPSLRASNELRIDGVEVGGLATERLQDGWFAFACRAADGTARTLTSGEGEPGWLDRDALGPLLPAAVLAAEDQRFLQHAGFDPVEITKALAAADRDHDMAEVALPSTAIERPLRGASTLTQQLARTLFTGGERTVARKLRELLYALEMERTLGKERILLLYLNTVDWGPGLCGARAAARTYFGKRPAQLTPLQAAWLAGILRAPHAAHARQYRGDAPDPERAHWVLMQMRDLPKNERMQWSRQPLVLAAPKGERAALLAGSANLAPPHAKVGKAIAGIPVAAP
ncbi:MAG: biosynthetic peptidoglycan transglycosylase [Burkholderiaceae bacterium]|nr:biosynthetic peptidoglycan transglycosylase [Burkholderiaceae bacterium]